MERRFGNLLQAVFDAQRGPNDKLIPRWILLRALAAIYFSAFYSLLYQIKGLIGPAGILPARQYLAAVARNIPSWRYWYAPSLFWIASSDFALMLVTWLGLFAAVAAFLNLWPRFCFLICFACFLSFVGASSEFSSYQSDGMLLEAGFIALFFAPRGLTPGWGAHDPPSRASLFLLQWEWFRIYFESGIVKLLSGDEQWRNMTAMDEYYQNGPLPTWIGWYVEHLPHWFHAATAVGTLAMELVVVWMLFLPRRARLICFCIVTPWEIGVIVTANYTFLNYLVLSLGFLLLRDEDLRRFAPMRWRSAIALAAAAEEDELGMRRGWLSGVAHVRRRLGLAVAALMLTWVGYNTMAEMLGLVWRESPLPTAPVTALDPFRIANQYGLFAVMTRGRYEIEFQGSNDGDNWTPYLFRNKPQLLNEAPRVYAPYQPRFDWNLWFASLGDWQQTQIVSSTEECLLTQNRDVEALFRSDPFEAAPPRFVRAVLWRYWFTSMDEKRRTGNWWRRDLLGVYAPVLTRTPDGRPTVVAWPDELPPHG